MPRLRLIVDGGRGVRVMTWIGLMLLSGVVLSILWAALDAAGGPDLSAFVSRGMVLLLTTTVIWKAWTGEWIG